MTIIGDLFLRRPTRPSFSHHPQTQQSESSPSTLTSDNRDLSETSRTYHDPSRRSLLLSRRLLVLAEDHLIGWLTMISAIYAMCRYGFGWIPGTPPPPPIHISFGTTTKQSTVTSSDPTSVRGQAGLTCTELRRPAFNERWVTARDQDFVRPENLRAHFSADWIVERRRIAAYRIRMMNGTWSTWYIPGMNDVEPLYQQHDESFIDRSIWNKDSYQAGRRRWTSLVDHWHQVCYYNDDDDGYQPAKSYFISRYTRRNNYECVQRGPQGTEWVTANTTIDFLNSSNLREHAVADLHRDPRRRICKYRIQQQLHDPRHIRADNWSEWKYPGLNDVTNYGKNDSIWNPDTHVAGRRDWTLFADHHHQVCYCFDWMTNESDDHTTREPNAMEKFIALATD